MKFFLCFLIFCVVSVAFIDASPRRRDDDDNDDCDRKKSSDWNIETEEIDEDGAKIIKTTGESGDGCSKFVETTTVTEDGTVTEKKSYNSNGDGSSSSSSSSSSSGNCGPGETIEHSRKVVDGVLITLVITKSDDGSSVTIQTSKKSLDGSSDCSESESIPTEVWEERCESEKSRDG